jgi:hypothetical protein
MLLSPGVAPVPMGLIGEAFILRREGVELTLRDGGLSVKSARCTLYLTSLRLCFVLDAVAAAGGGVALAALDVPLQGLRGDPDFVQPFFGANYLTVAVAPVPGRGLRGDGGAGPAAGATPLRATFARGGCATFLHFFFRLVEQYRVADVRARDAALAALAAPRAADAYVSQQEAFFDPSDPSVVYLTQPSWTAAADAPRAPGWGAGAAAPAQAPPAAASPAEQQRAADNTQQPGGAVGMLGTIGRVFR